MKMTFVATKLLLFCAFLLVDLIYSFQSSKRLPNSRWTGRENRCHYRSLQLDESLQGNKFDFNFNCRDISPNNDGGIIKKIIRRGNGGMGYPQNGDVVVVDWVIYDEDQNVIHDSFELEETFQFTLGARYQVIPAFEVAVKTMHEGEIAFLKVSPEYGFGNHSEPPFKPNQTLYVEFTLEELIVGIRQFESVSPDYNIKDEIYRKIDNGEINLADIPVMDEKPIESQSNNINTDSIHQRNDDGIPAAARIPATPMPMSLESPQSNPSVTTPNEDRSTRRYYNPEKDTLDPNRTLRGIGNGHTWDESIDQIIVEVAIPEDLEKSDIHVEMSSTSLQVISLKGDFEFGGEFFGKISPLESTWVIDGDDATSAIRGRRLIFYFQKASSLRDLWGSFFRFPKLTSN